MTLHVNFLLSVYKTVQRSEWDYADIIKRQCASKARNRGKNGVADIRGFGIIRKAALYQGFGPGTVKMFLGLWNKKQT
jgi:hypothetical protein